MTTEQEHQVKAHAWKILTQVDVMTTILQGIVNYSLADVPLETVEKTFSASLPHAIARIRDLLESET